MAEPIFSATQSEDVYPVVPLPNPGEGGPIPDMGFPAPDGSGSDGSNIPVTPLPSPEQGEPIPDVINPGNGGGIIGSIITVIPRPIIPCYFCSSTQYSTVRFLNTASAYNPFLIYIGNQLVINSLASSEISQYGRVSAGSQTITVAGQNGYVYIQKPITVHSGQAMTVAIIATPSGLDLMEIPDNACNSGYNVGCFRAINLSVTNQSLNVSLNNNYVNFQGVAYKQITGTVYLPTGTYNVQVYNNPSTTGSPLVTSSFYVRSNTFYTLYLFNWNPSKDAIQTLIVEDYQS